MLTGQPRALGDLGHVHCRIRVSFTDKYPLEPPEILFLEPSPVHPHIYRSASTASPLIRRSVHRPSHIAEHTYGIAHCVLQL